MKKHHLLFSAAGAVMLMALPSCDNDCDSSSELLLPTAVVTVCPEADGGFFMQLDDDTRLLPANMSTSPFGSKEVRALVNYTDEESAGYGSDIRSVRVNWIDSIRTKLPVPTLGDEDAAVYGDDPLEIVQDWVTVAEDGYLTLRIRTQWGIAQAIRTLDLVTGTNSEDPFEMELRYNAKGDRGGQWGDALIAFNLNNLPTEELPAATAGTAKIKLKWKSFTGDKSTEFDIHMRPKVRSIDARNIRYSGQIK